VALEQVVRVSIEAAVLAIVVAVVCAVFPRLKASHRALLWWLVSAKLLLGLAPIPALTIEALPAPKTIAAPAASATEPAIGQSLREIKPAFAPSRAAALWAWVGVVSLLSLAMLPGWLRVRGLMRRGRAIDDDERSEVIARAARSAGLRRAPRVLAVAITTHARLIDRDLAAPGGDEAREFPAHDGQQRFRQRVGKKLPGQHRSKNEQRIRNSFRRQFRHPAKYDRKDNHGEDGPNDGPRNPDERLFVTHEQVTPREKIK